MSSTGHHSAFHIGFSHFRAFLLILSIAGLIAIAAIYAGRDSIDDKVCKHCHAELNQLLNPIGYEASVASAEFVDGQGILIRDLQIAEIANSISATGPPRILCRIKSLQLGADAGLGELVLGKVSIEEIRVSGGEFIAARDAKGKWNLEQFIQKLAQQKSEKPQGLMPIYFDDCAVKLQPNGDSQTELEFEQISGSFSRKKLPHQTQSDLWKFQIRTREQTVQSLDLRGEIDIVNKTWTAELVAGNAQLHRRWAELLGSRIATRIKRIDSISGVTNFQVKFAGQGFKKMPRFRMAGSVSAATVRDRQFPEPLSKINAKFEITDQSLRFWDVTGNTGIGQARLAYQQQGLLQPTSWELLGNLEKLNLHPGLRKLLPESVQATWDAFSPAGLIDLRFHYWKKNGVPGKDLTAQLINASFQHSELPFRFQSCAGKVSLNDQRCDVDIQALENGQIIAINGTIKKPGMQATGYIDFRCSKPIAISDKVLRALRYFPEVSSVIGDFAPAGKFSFVGRLRRDNPDQETQIEYQVYLSECNARYKYFDYPFHKLSGIIAYANGSTTFKNITAINGSSSIRCDGKFDATNGLSLRFVASQVPLDEQLRLALTPDHKKMWADISPRGTVNHMVVDLNRKDSSRPPDIAITANIYGQQGKPSSVSIRPVWFPYDIDQINGQFVWDRDGFTMKNVSGKHGRSWFACQGSGKFTDDDWSLRLYRIKSGSVRIDQQLLLALPESMQSAIEKVSLAATFSLSGEMNFGGKVIQQSLATGQDQFGVKPINHVVARQFSNYVSWNVRLDTESAKMNIGLPIDNIAGGVELQGRQEGDAFACQGELDIESAQVNGLNVSRLKGPLWMDEQRLAFGRRVTGPDPTSPARPLTGRMFDGNLALDAEVRMQSDYPFVVNALLNDGNLQTAYNEFATSEQKMRGRGYASLILYGNTKGTHSLRGQGAIRLRDALIEVPVMEKLGDVLPVGDIDKTKFDESNVDFQIHGEDVDLNRFEMIGNRISLIGNGKMNLEQEIDLNFFTVAGRNRINIPILTDLLRAGSQQILWIRVDGTLQNPKTHKEVMPALNESLKLLQQDLEVLQGKRSTNSKSR